MTDKNKEEYKKMISYINPCKTTNLLAAIDISMYQIQNRNYKNESTSIMILSDG